MICQQCNKSFSPRVVIDGKQHILSSRKYCLICSPFGKHNTRPFGYVKKTTEVRHCSICSKPYKHKGKICFSCVVNFRRFKIKKDAVQLLGGKCQRCGYDRCSAALTFHHKDKNSKLFSIGGNYTRSWDNIKKELMKCELLCNNCHTELHWKEVDHLREKVMNNWVITNNLKLNYLQPIVRKKEINETTDTL